MKKVGMSVSLSIKTVMKIEEYMEEHGGSFSGFMDRAANYYLNRDLPVAHDSIQDSEPIKRPDPVDPSASEPKKNVFNFDDVNID